MDALVIEGWVPGLDSTEMSLHVLAYNLNRVMKILGFAKTLRAMKLAGA
jgi:hypothetical protein